MLVNTARNNKELEQILKPALRIAVEYLMQKISEENQYAIMHEVYYGEVSSEEGWYERTGEFAKAWEYQVHSTGNLSNTVEGRFYYAPNVMHYNPSKGQHGTPTGSTAPGIPNIDLSKSSKKYDPDARPYLAEIIYEGLAGHIFGEGYWTKKRNAWEVLEKRLGKTQLKKLFKEALDYAGLKVKSYSSSWRQI